MHFFKNWVNNHAPSKDLMEATQGYEIIKSNWALKLIGEERFAFSTCLLQSWLFSLAKEVEQYYSYYVTDSHHPNETSRVLFLSA